MGKRLIDHMPFGHWHTQTFIAGLSHDGLVAPWVLVSAMNGASFETYVMREVAPALQPGQIVAADNPSSHESGKVIDLLRAQGNDLIFLPPRSPDLNFNEITRAFTQTNGVHAFMFSKRKTLIRKASARTYHALWNQVGAVCDLFKPTEWRNSFIASGYGVSRTRHALVRRG